MFSIIFMSPYVSISQAELSDFSKQWIYGLGCPEVHVGCSVQTCRQFFNRWSIFGSSPPHSWLQEFNTFCSRLPYKALGQACHGFSSTGIECHVHGLLLASLACRTMKCTYTIGVHKHTYTAYTHTSVLTMSLFLHLHIHLRISQVGFTTDLSIVWNSWPPRHRWNRWPWVMPPSHLPSAPGRFSGRRIAYEREYIIVHYN